MSVLRIASRLSLLLLTTWHGAAAQQIDRSRLVPRNAPADESPLRSVTVQQPVKPAFLITPLVQRITARRGQLVNFEYEIESNLKATKLEISMVGMSQQENGVILPDPNAVPTGALRLLSPATLNLAKGQKSVIRCQLRVPSINSPFLTYGVLAREVPLDNAPAGNEDQPAVGIRFVTQYLLRADVEVTGVRGDSVKQLEIQSAGLTPRNGAALVSLAINNPTDTAMEYQIRTQLVSQKTRKVQTSRLYVPVRENQQVPERYNSRILAQTRLQMIGTLPESVFPGAYTLKVELMYRGRVYTRAEFPVEIRTGDFPAQDATIVRVSDDIIVEPPAVQLSLRRGGARLQAFAIRNESQQKVTVRVRPQNHIGELGDWLTFRPDTLELSPGQTRKVLVSLGRKRDFSQHCYAFAEVEVRPETGRAIGTQQIPVALLTASEDLPLVEAGELTWASEPGFTGFTVDVRNTGEQHLPLFGRLQLRDQFGRGFVMESGYGRWVLPHAGDQLRFRLPRTPPPGSYNVRLEIPQGEGQEPLQRDQVIQLQPTLERMSGDPQPPR